MSDTKYLKLRHNTWFFQKRVPKVLSSKYPDKVMFDESLKTGDIREARIRRDFLLGKLRQEELELQVISPNKLAFQRYVAELKVDADRGNVSSDPNQYLSWAEVADPREVGKADNPEYVEAYKALINGRTDSDKYGMTLNELLQRFLQHSEQEDDHTVGTRDRYQKTVALYTAFHNVNDLQLQELTREQATNFISHYRAKKLAGATINGHISRLKTLIEFAYRHAWFASHNPFDKHGINTTRDRKKKQPFTPEETKKLLGAVKEESASMRLLVWLGLYTGARISELVSIPLSATNEEDGVQLLGIATESKGKTKAARRWVPVPKRCMKLFEQVKQASEREESPHLFHDLVSIRPDGRLAYGVTKKFGDIKKKHVTSRSDKGFHSFRVMMATALQRAEVSELLAAHLLGHSRKGLTMSYGYYSKGYTAKQLTEAQARIVQEFDEYVGEKISFT